jgi:hypothetical protein
VRELAAAHAGDRVRSRPRGRRGMYRLRATSCAGYMDRSGRVVSQISERRPRNGREALLIDHPPRLGDLATTTRDPPLVLRPIFSAWLALRDSPYQSFFKVFLNRCVGEGHERLQAWYRHDASPSRTVIASIYFAWRGPVIPARRMLMSDSESSGCFEAGCLKPDMTWRFHSYRGNVCS